MAKNLEISFLLDFYGSMLTDKQRDVVELYYNEDLSLAEIAENYGISRQGVRDVIVRAEAAMTEIEDRTGIIRRFLRCREAVSNAEQAAEAIEKINRRQYDNRQISENIDIIRASVHTLKEQDNGI